jgi:hypothetical protein
LDKSSCGYSYSYRYSAQAQVSLVIIAKPATAAWPFTTDSSIQELHALQLQEILLHLIHKFKLKLKLKLACTRTDPLAAIHPIPTFKSPFEPLFLRSTSSLPRA